MKTFYVANDDFSAVGHPYHTLKSLCHENDEEVILLTQTQKPGLSSRLMNNCMLIECLPSVDDGRYVSPPRLGAVIAENLLKSGISDGDLIVLKMPFPYLLLSVIYAVSLSSVSTKQCNLSILISQTDEGYQSEHIKYSDCFALVSKLPEIIRNRIIILNEREGLRQYWASQFPSVLMSICGYVTQWFKTEVDNVLNTDEEDNSYELVYLGEARSEKGFRILADVLDSGLITTPVTIHRDANLNNMNGEYNDAIAIMEYCHRRGQNIKLVNQRQESSFAAFFKSTNIAVMLYSSEYRLRGSGVVQECAAAGMFVIAYEDLGFHSDYPDHVLTVSRDVSTQELAAQIQSCVNRIVSGEIPKPDPVVLTAKEFRANLLRGHPERLFDIPSESNQFVFVVSNNVHKQGCSKIIEAQQDEILRQGLVPVYISFEWPDLSIEWSDYIAFKRVWDMQMNSPDSSYGYQYLTIPLVTKSNVLQRYNSFQYKELVGISKDVDAEILDYYLAWRDSPVLVMNYLHHAPILEEKLRTFDKTFLELHDITSIQQAIRIEQDDPERLNENLREEIAHLQKFKYKATLSSNEVKILAEKGCQIEEHSYLDVLIRQANHQELVESKSQASDTEFFASDYVCITGSDHPSNVIGINSFCEREVKNTNRTIPIIVCGLVCQQIKIPENELKRANIHLLGFVPNISKLIRNALLTLNPVNVGSGVPIKVLESIAYNVPCLVSHRTIIAMQPHPLVVEFDFETKLLDDASLFAIANTARDTYKHAPVIPNKLGTFLNEHAAS